MKDALATCTEVYDNENTLHPWIGKYHRVEREESQVNDAPLYEELKRLRQENTRLKYVGDITDLPTGEGWLYLAVVLDLCSRATEMIYLEGFDTHKQAQTAVFEYLDRIGIPILRLPSRPRDTRVRGGEEGTCCGPMMGWME